MSSRQEILRQFEEKSYYMNERITDGIENRTVKIVNGAIADDFAGHTRHVYKVKMGK